MAVKTIEGWIENGQLHLPEDMRLPDRAKVYVVITDDEDEEPEVFTVPPLPPVVHFRSPRLVKQEGAARLQKVAMEVIGEEE